MDKTESERISSIDSILIQTYPHAHIALTYTNPWELLVAVILSAQCTDIMVNKVTPKLFSQYPTVHSFTQASQQILELAIRSTGFYRNKAKHIISSAQKIVDVYHGMVPNTMESLLTLPGVARKTANVVLANAFDISVGIAVDTHVIRLSQRLRLVHIDSIGGHQPVTISIRKKSTIEYYKDADPMKIEQQLMNLFPQTRWKSLSYQLIDHGRSCCIAKMPHCTQCPLASYCPTYRG